MAIKVNGTTVIDDSRNLVNIASGAGSSTALNAVGTYRMGNSNVLQTLSPGATISNFRDLGFLSNGYSPAAYYGNGSGNGDIGSVLSGTWRMMDTQRERTGNTDTRRRLFVRIS